jgi:hypothetical protein
MSWQWNSKEEETYRHSVQDKLDAILRQTTITNGRMTAAETAISKSDKAIEMLKAGYFVGAFVFGAVFVWALTTWGPGK